MTPKFGDRIKDLRKCDYGEGAISGYQNEGIEYWGIRWDNPGLDSEWLEEPEFEVIETKYCRCGHIDSAHFDGNLEHQACLHEWCKCVKYKTREVK